MDFRDINLLRIDPCARKGFPGRNLVVFPRNKTGHVGGVLMRVGLGNAEDVNGISGKILSPFVTGCEGKALLPVA